MNTSQTPFFLAALLLILGFCQISTAQEVGKPIKSEHTYKLYGLKEKPNLVSYSSDQLEDYISKNFKYDLQKEITYDRSGRITQKKDFRRAGLELVVVETETKYAYDGDTITCEEYNEDGTLRLIFRYLEKKQERQIFQHSVFRVPEIMTPGITSKPRRRETIHYYNLTEAEQQKLLSNLPDNYPVELIFKNEIEEDGLIKFISTSSKGGSWPPNLLKHKITDPKTGKSALFHCQSTFEEIDIEYFPTNSDTIAHRIYKKSTANFGPDKNKSPSFRPDQSVPNATTRHEEWLTISPNDSIRINTHFTFVGAKEVHKSEKKYLKDQLVKTTESRLEKGLWETPYSKNYFRHNHFSLLEISQQNNKGSFQNYYLTVYEYY